MFFENFEFELIDVLVSIGSIFIIYIAWKSTYVREDRLPPAAVLIIESNRRRLLQDVINQHHSVYIDRPPSRQSNDSNTTEELDFENDIVNQQSIENFQIPGGAPSLQEVINEVNDLAAGSGQLLMTSDNNYRSVETVDDNLDETFEDSIDIDQQQLINDMDNQDTTEVLRRRRVLFYAQDNNNGEPTENRQADESANTRPIRRENLNLQTGDSAHADNCSNENNENENISKSEVVRTDTKAQGSSNTQADGSTGHELRIKLKYLNDELRLVRGSPLEQVGDFKRRTFVTELAAQKLVRLVFNGHVLQPDSKTLQACGLFDNCVVHCLIQKRPMPENLSGNGNILNNYNQNRTARPANQGIRNLGISSFLDINTNGPLFIYCGAAIITIIIIFCWYCRIQYSSIFSLYSTIGLILLTGMFLVIIPLVILIERDVAI